MTLITLDPSARSYTFMGLAYRHLGRFEEAAKYFNEGLKLDPRNASCLYNLGFIEERQGNSARADELFQQALRSNPDFSDALLELANLRMRDKKYAEAAELLRHYVKVGHDVAEAIQTESSTGSTSILTHSSSGGATCICTSRCSPPRLSCISL